MGNVNALCEHQHTHKVHTDNDKLIKFTVRLCGTTWWIIIVVNDSDRLPYLLLSEILIFIWCDQNSDRTYCNQNQNCHTKELSATENYNPIINASNEMFMFRCVSICLHNSKRFTSQTDTSFGKRFCYYYYYYCKLYITQTIVMVMVMVMVVMVVLEQRPWICKSFSTPFTILFWRYLGLILWTNE